jgi:3',5'-cyclic AMP phosphodiesterase CpdA
MNRVNMGALLLVLLAIGGTCQVFARDFQFAVVGDTRPPLGTSSYANFELLVGRINASNPDLLVNLGDLIYGYGSFNPARSWDRYAEVVAKIRCPYYQVPGNHDIFSADAEKLYVERFQKLYYSFDHQDVHFVILDTTERAKWGYVSDRQLAWLKEDLAASSPRATYVFMHFPLWDLSRSRVDEEYHAFWLRELHPLFRRYNVKAVFAGHVHSYGPTQEIDGIKYFITGGGGAELREWYEDYGGRHHFMLVHVRGDSFDYRIVTDRAVLTEEQADVHRNQQFADEYSNHAILSYEQVRQELQAQIAISLRNPREIELIGSAHWKFPRKLFDLDPEALTVRLAPGESKTYRFTLKVLEAGSLDAPFPRLEFRLSSGQVETVFSREVVFRRHLTIPPVPRRLNVDGRLEDWSLTEPVLLFDSHSAQPAAEVYLAYDPQYLYVAAKVRNETPVNDHAGHMIFLNDTFIVAFDLENGGRQLEFSRSSNGVTVYDRARGQQVYVPGNGLEVSIVDNPKGYTTYEIALPGGLLKPLSLTAGSTFGMDLGVKDVDPSGERRLIQLSPGIGPAGVDEVEQNQLHFAAVVLGGR